MSNSDIPAVDHLSIEAKRQLLAILARDLLRARSGLISVEDAAGEVFVYAIPPDARTRASKRCARSIRSGSRSYGGARQPPSGQLPSRRRRG